MLEALLRLGRHRRVRVRRHLRRRRAVRQVINADPSFYLNNVNQTQFSIDGSWQVLQTGGDDD